MNDIEEKLDHLQAASREVGRNSGVDGMDKLEASEAKETAARNAVEFALRGEPVAYLVTGGRTYNDKAFISHAQALRSIEERLDGSRSIPLYTSPSAAVVAGEGWQPIETAPKDGRLVDLWVNGARLPDCYWFTLCTEWEQEPHWQQKYAECSDKEASYPISKPPTHWRPLPKAPAAMAKEPK